MKVEVQDRPGLSDPWNAARTRAVYTYYGMHQRATAIADADLDVSAEADRAEHFYYDAGWRLLERRRDVFANAAFGSEPAFALDEVDQFVWGQRYIDELMYHRTAEGAGLYALTDRNFSVIAMSDDASEPEHRTRYTAYGEARTTPNADVNADGVVNSIDQGLLLGAFGKGIGDVGYLVEADLNNDGTIDTLDLGLLTGSFGQSVPPGDVTTTDTPVGYAGYIFDDATGLYCVRFRWYAPEIGRWLSRDPAGYIAGMNLYDYSWGSPVSYSDSLGLCPALLTPSSIQCFIDHGHHDQAAELLRQYNKKHRQVFRDMVRSANAFVEFTDEVFAATSFKLGAVAMIDETFKCCKNGRVYEVSKKGTEILLGVAASASIENEMNDGDLPPCPEEGNYKEILLGPKVEGKKGNIKGEFELQCGVRYCPEGEISFLTGRRVGVDLGLRLHLDLITLLEAKPGEYARILDGLAANVGIGGQFGAGVINLYHISLSNTGECCE